MLRNLRNIYNEAFCENSYYGKPLTIFAKSFILDVLQGSGYACYLITKRYTCYKQMYYKILDRVPSVLLVPQIFHVAFQ